MSQSLQPQRDAALFPTLTDEQIAILESFGQEIVLAPDERLFVEGEEESAFYILLEGRLKVTRQIEGGEVVIAMHEPGGFTGALSMLSGDKSIASGFAVGAAGARVRSICVDDFRRMLSEQPEIARIILATMAARRPAADTLVIEREKLASLGTMAAGLAHELNNPASAARRSASELRKMLRTLQSTATTLICLLPDATWTAMEQRIAGLSESRHDTPPLSPLERSDREEVLGTWLEERDVEDAWNLAPLLADAGFDTDCLVQIAAWVGEEALSPALAWAAVRLESDDLLYGIEQSTGRISDLVHAIKSYSYMDQAPHQEVDITQGLENTLTILAHCWRKRGIEIIRKYDPNLPKVEGYGSELNQVWTNLLDNAIDAVPAEGGKITIETATEDASHVLVSITDNGSGIPPEIQDRIFEPFFTTKEPGKGTGLGLDISYRIVTQRHSGDIRVVSHPGETCFEVRLPVRRSGSV